MSSTTLSRIRAIEFPGPTPGLRLTLGLTGLDGRAGSHVAEAGVAGRVLEDADDAGIQDALGRVVQISLESQAAEGGR